VHGNCGRTHFSRVPKRWSRISSIMARSRSQSLGRRDARVAARDLEGDHARRKGLLHLADP